MVDTTGKGGASADAYREVMKTVNKEFLALKRLNNRGADDYIVRFIGFGEWVQGGCQVLVMEYMQGGDLRHVLDEHGHELTDSLRLNLARKASQAVAFIHSMGVTHRDIKSENFLVNSDFTVLKVSTYSQY